jgi:hypothetical protein
MMKKENVRVRASHFEVDEASELRNLIWV